MRGCRVARQRKSFHLRKATPIELSAEFSDGTREDTLHEPQPRCARVGRAEQSKARLIANHSALPLAFRHCHTSRNRRSSISAGIGEWVTIPALFEK